MDNIDLNRRDFIKRTGQAALTVGAGLTLDSLLSNCATLGETREDVANIKWDTNPAIPVPKDGCYVGWQYDIVGNILGQVLRKYWRKVASSPDKAEHDLERYHGKPYGKLPAVWSFSDRLVGRDTGFFPKGILEGVYNKGVIPLVRYHFFPDFEKVAKGKYDKTLHNFAQAAKDFGKPFFFVPYPEVNICAQAKHVHPWAGSGKGFKKAWKHMHNIFEGEGANKYAVWGLHLIGPRGMQPFSGFAVEDNLVDWIGFTIYNLKSESYWTGSLGSLMNEDYWWAKRNYPSKPIALWELGTSNTSRQGRWIKNAYKTIKKMPRIKLAVYTECIFGGIPHDNTTISQESVRAYKEAISDPYFIGSKNIKRN